MSLPPPSSSVRAAVVQAGAIPFDREACTDKAVRLQRRDAAGVVQTSEPKLEDPVRPDDLIFVRESLF